METIGVYLKRQREIRNISLEEVARTTKISLKSLQALETDDLNSLPGQVFAKGFVQSYAKAVGLDVHEALLQLEEYLKSTSDNSPKKDRIKWLREQHWLQNRWLLVILALVGLVVITYLSSW